MCYAAVSVLGFVETGKTMAYSWNIEIEETFAYAGKRSAYELEMGF